MKFCEFSAVSHREGGFIFTMLFFVLLFFFLFFVVGGYGDAAIITHILACF